MLQRVTARLSPAVDSQRKRARSALRRSRAELHARTEEKRAGYERGLKGKPRVIQDMGVIQPVRRVLSCHTRSEGPRQFKTASGDRYVP